MMKPALFIALLTLPVAALPCAAQPNEPRQSAPAGLSTGLRSMPQSLFPYSPDASEAKPVLDLLFETLLTRDPESYDHLPGIAQRWSLSKDKLSFTFWIDQRARFADGTPVTADDVAFSYNIVDSDLPVMEPWRAHLEKMDKVTVNKDGSVTFRLHKPGYAIFDIVAGLKILKKGHYEPLSKSMSDSKSPLHHNPLGSGAWRIAMWNNDTITLEKRPDHWNAAKAAASDSGRILRRTFTVHPSHEEEWKAFQAGKLDVIGLTPELALTLEKSKDTARDFVVVKARNAIPPDFHFIGWNTDHKIFRDFRARQAMAHLINLENWDGPHSPYTTPAIGPYSPRSPEFEPALTPYKFDPRKAVALLKAAGWEQKGGRFIRENEAFSLTVLYPEEGIRQFSYGLSQWESELKKVGIVMTARAMKWKDLGNKIYLRDFDAVLMTGSRVVDENLYRHFHSAPQARENFSHYYNPEVNELLEKHAEATDRKERIELARRLQRLIWLDQPWTFLTELKYTLYAVRKDIVRPADSLPYDIGLSRWTRSLTLK